MTTTSPPTTYDYTEYAIGGVAGRNKVTLLADVPIRRGMGDCFTSVYRHSAALKEWVDTHRNKDGNPTVAGFDGAVLAVEIPYDIDAPSLTAALTEARQLVHHLIYVHEIPGEAIRLHFSGGKGFHVGVPITFCGPVEPAVNVPSRVRRMALGLVEGLGLTTIDTTFYEKLRLRRVENTRHPKRRLFKVPITVEELNTLTIDEIEALAAKPRDVERLPDDEWLPRPALVARWQATDVPEPQASHRPPPAPRDAADRERQTIAAAAFAAVWPQAGNRHRAALALDGGLIGNGWTKEDADAFVLDVTARAMGAEAAARDAEWRRGGGTTAARVAQGDRIIGWPTLAALVGDTAVNVALHLFGMVDAEAILEPDGAVAPCARCPELEAVIETQKARLAALEPLHQEVKDLREEQSLVAAVHRNTTIKTERATAIATLNRVAGDLSRGQADDRGRVRVPLAAIAESAGCSTKRASAHLEKLQALGVGIIKETEGEWRDVVDPTTGVIRHLPTQATYITVTQPKLEILRTLATVRAPATEEEPAGWGGRRQASCPDHPDAGIVRLAHCAACRRLLSDVADDDSLSGQDGPIGHETAGRKPPPYQSGQDDRIERGPEPPRPTRDVPDGFRECVICWKLGRFNVCSDHDQPLDDLPPAEDPVPPDAIDILLLAHDAGYPELPVRQGLQIDAGREAWTAWLAAASPGQLHHVRVLLRQLKGEAL